MTPSASNPPSRHRRACRSRRAFSLIEAVATMTILALVMTTTSRLILVATDGYTQSAVRNQMHVELSITLDRIVRELQQMELKPQDEIAPNINSVTATSITWNTDSTLALSGSQIVFTENGGSPRVLLDDVSAFSITCFTESNASMAASLSGAATDGVRRILISISSTRVGVTETLRTKLFLRSCMTGGSAT